jgi:hypothetical protein
MTGTELMAALLVVAAMSPYRPAAAQIGPGESSMQALRAARSLKCSFPLDASAAWDGDEPKVKSATQEFGFHIDGIDPDKRTARLIGNAGANDVLAVYGPDSISFVEVVPLGAVNLTTVHAWRDKGGHFKAVHSRHTAIGGPSPSQNYGHCQPW